MRTTHLERRWPILLKEVPNPCECIFNQRTWAQQPSRVSHTQAEDALQALRTPLSCQESGVLVEVPNEERNEAKQCTRLKRG
jgi:hypothetical protein